MTKEPKLDSSSESGEPRTVYVLHQADPPPGLGEIDFKRLIHDVWARRWWIVALTALAIGAGLAYGYVAAPIYRAEAVLMMRESKPGIGLSSQLSQLAGLADLAGISVGASNRQEPLGILRSRGLAGRFLATHPRAAHVAEIADIRLEAAERDAGKSFRRVVDYFQRKVLAVTDDKRTGLVTVAIHLDNPDAAAKWANALVSQLNEEMRARALREAENNIRYLGEQLRATDLIQMQQAISQVLEGEMQKAMLARGTEGYAFRVIDKAEPPVKRLKPKRLLILFASAIAGFVVAVALALFVPAAVRSVRHEGSQDRASQER